MRLDSTHAHDSYYCQQPYQMVPTIKQKRQWSTQDCAQELSDSWSSTDRKSGLSCGGYRRVQSSPTKQYQPHTEGKPKIQAAALAVYSGYTPAEHPVTQVPTNKSHMDNKCRFMRQDSTDASDRYCDQQPYQMVPKIKQKCQWSTQDCAQDLGESWSSTDRTSGLFCGGYRSVQSSPSKQYPPHTEGKPKIQAAALAGYSGRKTIHLWQFLLELLADKNCKHFIRWTGVGWGFELSDPNEVA
ncbi:hypothetical protein KUTeg_006021 [Tegillarca granosa]|uniref:ETS domain-containing protein n=1 Tax=Tegillarca granosa TaxID=220873 RepID=A0ABQ9FHK8_TEGGR|nr:hypothetical protein KUTeg_006021 [Tegillarca granosa]